MARGAAMRCCSPTCTCPDMDGYALAETIRRGGGGAGPAAAQRRMPILALTANALRGEAMRAQAAGMDEYLTKPLQLHLLKAALDKWLPRGDAVTTPATLAASSVRSARQSSGCTGGRRGGAEGAWSATTRQIVREFLADYRTSAGRLATELRAAQAADDAPADRRHRPQAQVLVALGRGTGLGRLCAELENACRTHRCEGILRGMVQFELALLAVDAQISDLLARR